MPVPNESHPGASRCNLLVDSHVHLYDRFRPTVFLDGAYENFVRAAAALGAGPDRQFMLILARSRTEHGFAKLGDWARSGGGSPTWQAHESGESRSIRLIDEGGRELVLAAGVQVVTTERLEVLGLGTDGAVPDGLSIDDTLQEIRRLGALPVLPWGFGKWLGQRGRIVDRLVRQSTSSELFLGDNGGRPGWLGTPAQFHLNPELPVLRGSDPLPLPDGETAAGSFGFSITCPWNPHFPVASLLDALRDGRSPVISYGKLEAAWPFLRNQIAILLRNRLSRNQQPVFHAR
jgi:hypothetical protein